MLATHTIELLKCLCSPLYGDAQKGVTHRGVERTLWLGYWSLQNLTDEHSVLIKSF
jgi:hypothetical protein